MLAKALPYLALSGAPFDRGYCFGEQRRRAIAYWVKEWLRSLEVAGIDAPEQYVDAMLRETEFLPDISRAAPDLLQEINGIAAGSGIPFELIFGAQLMDEEWAYRQRTRSVPVTREKCSSVAVHTTPGMTWIGQNMDLGSYTDGHQLVLRIDGSPNSPATLVVTIGGMIGLMGVNARQVGLCVNALPQLGGASTGLPVAFVVRRLLQCTSAAEAAALVQRLPHASSQHYLIADPYDIHSFEASPTGVERVQPRVDGRVLHTNHPLATEQGGTANSVARLRALESRLLHGSPAFEEIAAALSSCDDPLHPVCREYDPSGAISPVTGLTNFTVASMISALRADARDFKSWISNGPPASRGYTQISSF